MARPVETKLTISCLQCDWSVETTNTSTELSAAFLEEAQAHADRHEQHAIEIVQRLKVYSTNYVEPTRPPKDARTVARSDAGIQTGFLDRTRRPINKRARQHLLFVRLEHSRGPYNVLLNQRTTEVES